MKSYTKKGYSTERSFRNGRVLEITGSHLPRYLRFVTLEQIEKKK